MPNSLPHHRGSSELKIPDLTTQLPAEEVSAQIMQSMSAEEHGGGGLMVFFGIGMAINIIMIVAFFIWAVKQWKRHDESKK